MIASRLGKWMLRNAVLSLAMLAVMSAAGCNKQATRTDAQVTADVQGRINADQAVPDRQQVAVQASNGVVTLSGSVTSDAERTAAAADAAAASGVRTVVNNIAVQTASAAPPVAPQDQAQRQAPPPAAPEQSDRKNKPRAAKQVVRAESMRQPPPQEQSQQPMMQQSQQAQAAPPPPAKPAPPQPPPQITLRSGTELSIRMLDTLDSETSNPGDTFRATLNAPVHVDSETVIPADSDVFGRVVNVHAAGRFKGSGLMVLELNRISFNGRTYQIRTDQWSKETTGRGKGTAEKVGGGAALGALIGGLAGGGKGAGIGAAVGAGAGGVTQAAIKAAQIKLGPESLLTFHLDGPLTVQPASSNERNSGRRRLD